MLADGGKAGTYHDDQTMSILCAPLHTVAGSVFDAMLGAWQACLKAKESHYPLVGGNTHLGKECKSTARS